MGCFLKGEHRALYLVLLLAVPAFGVLLAGDLCAGVANSACADCHELSETFHNTPHGVYFSQDAELAEASCEKCHGSAVDHLNSGDPKDILNPAKADQFGSSFLCLNCHKGHQFDDWAFSAHNTAGVNCASCHKIHTDFTAEKASEADLCYSCHSEVRAATFMPSHHPIAEGKLTCRDCHNVHGGETMFVEDQTSGELCYSCHAEKEGPFVYEHGPVQEDCMICHSAHGTVADNLLKQSEPALCLNCHSMHFHATVEGVEGTFVPPAEPDRVTESTLGAWKSGMLTKCTQCHTAVHGSDLPSQTISTGGNALTR